MLKCFRYIKSGVVLLLCVLLLAGCGAKEVETVVIQTPAPTTAPDITEDADKIVISEVMAKNRATLPDEEGKFSDWIELENISDSDVNLSGWFISDDEDELGWALPGIIMPARSRMIIYADGKDKADTYLHTDFSLSQGETVCLYNKHNYLVSSVLCESDTADVSIVRQADGTYKQSLYPTPLHENSAAGYDALQEALTAAGPLAIYEVVVSNFDSAVEMYLGYCDWIEVKNISDEAVQLNEFYLSDDDEDYRLWQFPQYTLYPGETKLVFCDDSGLSAANGVMHAPFSLDSVQEELYLYSESAGLIDYVPLRDIPYNCSYGRQDGENGWFFFESQTPNNANGKGYRRVSAAPVALEKDGVFNDVQSVPVALEAAGEIYYSMDGSLPTTNSTKYDGSFSVSETCVVRAISVEEGAMPSRSTSLSYIINEGHSLPILSLVSDNAGEFNRMYSNGMKNVELPGNLSLYESDSSFTIPCGIKMHGETSLILPKKNMSVRFRGAYGQDILNYDAFDGGVTEFTNLVLRAGQDYFRGIIRNEVCTNLALSASDNIVTQRSKHCVMYVNGEYRGIYTMMEKTNEQHYANLAGVSRDSVTVEESEVGHETQMYKDVFSFCINNDMSLPENYEHFCSVMDVDSLIDWIILEGVCANDDFTYGNLRYCRSSENDGKWRFMLYDMDSTLADTADAFYNVLSPYWLARRQVSLIIAPLLDNEQFVDRLLSRTAELLEGPLSNESIVKEIDRLAKIVAPEVERDYARYNMTLEKWEWNIQWMKDLIIKNDWAKVCENSLCDLLDLTEEERAHYFG